MYRTLILSLAVFCCVQAETPDEVIQEMKPKLDALNMRIDTYVEDGRASILLAQNYITFTITASENLLDQALIVLKETVEISKTNANANGQNIKQCVTQEELAVQNVTSSFLDKCRGIDASVKVLMYQLNAMSMHKDEIEKAPEDCKYNSNGDVTKLRSCLENTITGIDNHLISIIGYINDTISSYQQMTRDCIDTISNEKYLEIAQILSAFNDCINHS